MNRFRPNIVVEGSKAYAEDTWAHFRVAGIDFYGVKPCGRCSMTTVDQDKGEKGKEPYKTLSRYRLKDGVVYFGENLIHEGEGSISIGDLIEIIEKKAGISFPSSAFS